MDPKEYQQMVQRQSGRSPLLRDSAGAFVVGGLICAIGQAILEGWKAAGLNDKDAACAASMTLIALGALLTGLHVYEKIAKYAGAGTLVPITGFSNSVASPALEFKTEGFIIGTAAKMFTIAGPVLVYGLSASILYGILLWLMETV